VNFGFKRIIPIIWGESQKDGRHMDESVKTLIAEAFPDLERELLSRPFNLEDASGSIAAYMFRRYGVSGYQCSAAVKEALIAKLDAQPGLKRDPDSGEKPAWKPAS